MGSMVLGAHHGGQLLSILARRGRAHQPCAMGCILATRVPSLDINPQPVVHHCGHQTALSGQDHSISNVINVYFSATSRSGVLVAITVPSLPSWGFSSLMLIVEFTSSARVTSNAGSPHAVLTAGSCTHSARECTMGHFSQNG